MKREDLAQYELPDEPGVYFFKKGSKILYIGKAASLRDRVRSYFATDLVSARSPAIVHMVAEANRIAFTQTNSVLEALILEANLIKRHGPPYNVDQKDNKSFNYVVITRETFPRVLTVRGRELFLSWKKNDIKHVYGPFTSGTSLQEALKIVRRIFTYRDSRCVPCGNARNKNCRACFNRQIGLCPGVCTGDISKTDYARIVRSIATLFSGNFRGLKRGLAAEMQRAAKSEQFEKARAIKKQIEALTHVKDIALIRHEYKLSTGGRLNSGEQGARIEAFDVAHTSGSETVGVMTVVEQGEKVSSAYRKFKIRTATNDDTAALRELLARRLNHPEWPLPKVFVVDGGKGQLNAALKILADAGVMIPVVGVVKNEFHKPERLIGDTHAIAAYEKHILLANSEAHRFAIAWHRRRRGTLF